MDLRTTLGVTWIVFWVAQFFTMNRITSLRADCRCLEQAWDQRIPFLAGTSFVYFSTYAIFVGPLFLITDLQQFVLVLVAYTLVALVSNLIFLIYPTRVWRQEELPNTHLGLSMLSLFQRVSKPVNSFPSMHTAYALCAALAVYRVCGSWLGGLFGIWALAIAISTLTAKQHVLVDVIGGVAVGLVASGIVYG
jgi:membrane-associated phospholipid phosphatase